MLTAAAPAAGGGTSKWLTISSGTINSTSSTPSIARFGSNYEVIWAAKTGTGTWSVQGRQLNAAGKPIGSQFTALNNWAGLGLDPTILADGSTRLIAFDGDLTGSGDGPYESNAEYATTSSNGTSWNLGSGSLSASDLARVGGAAVVNDSGTIITGLARQDGVVYHVGASTQNPAPGTDPVTATTGNFSYDPGLGVDAKSHQVWALWYSNSGIKGQDGVNAQPIYPTKGSRVLAPASATSAGTGDGVQQDLSAATRPSGGVYTAYRNATGTKIEVWKLGSAKPIATLNPGPYGVNDVVLSAAPNGRLWVYWSDRNDWRATRSNKAATTFGPVSVATLPNAQDIAGNLIAGDGSAGPLEALAIVTTPSSLNEVIARQILPRLSISATPHSVKRAKLVHVRVTDAGDPVKGATVHFEGGKKKTNKSGKATFKIGKHARLGATKATVTIKGYAGVSTKITIKK